ncbi:transposase [Providencia rettgeri]|nr:transposase [Providencia rettgeri]
MAQRRHSAPSRQIFSTPAKHIAELWTHSRDYPTWCRYLNAHFQRYWKVHFAKKTRGAWHNVKYQGRYLKRPPILASMLKHCCGDTVVHHYYDHHSQQYRRQTLT